MLSFKKFIFLFPCSKSYQEGNKSLINNNTSLSVGPSSLNCLVVTVLSARTNNYFTCSHICAKEICEISFPYACQDCSALPHSTLLLLCYHWCYLDNFRCWFFMVFDLKVWSVIYGFEFVIRTLLSFPIVLWILWLWILSTFPRGLIHVA